MSDETLPIDVALVRMPFSEIGQPSLALGLLRACCDQVGVPARVYPAHLWFAEEIGLTTHNMIFEAISTTLLGEWIFSGTLFPDFKPDHDEYLKKVCTIIKVGGSPYFRHLINRYPRLDFAGLFKQIRYNSPEFIDKIATRILAGKPKIVGCTSVFQQHCSSLALLREIKKRAPSVITVIGGSNCEGDMGRTTFEQYPFVDFVVSGEADGFFGSMCQRLIEGDIDEVAQTLPPGVWGPLHRSGEAAITLTDKDDGAPIARLEDLNASPVPNYDDYFAALKKTTLGDHIYPALPFQTARGCWWGAKNHCTFCGISRTAMKFRAKSAENVMEQMFQLRDKYGISTFQGTEYIFDYRYFKTLLPRLKELDSHFRFEVKANLKESQVTAMADAGVLEVQPGIESLHDDILGLLKKGTSGVQNILLLKRGRNVGMSVHWNMLHTVPGDQDAWYQAQSEFIPLLHHLQPPHAFASIHYDRFSPYWKNPEAHGVVLQPAYGYRYVYPFSESVLKDVAYFFEAPAEQQDWIRTTVETNQGLVQFAKALSAWTEAFWAADNPTTLAATIIDGNHTHFLDTRAVATEHDFVIDGLAHTVFHAAEDGVSTARLYESIPKALGTSVTQTDIDQAIEELESRKVIIRFGHRILSLALRSPTRPLVATQLSKPTAELSPIAGILAADAVLDNARPNLALQNIRAPRERPLSEWMSKAK